MTAFGYFIKAITEDYANFDGRARRSEFWYFQLFSIVGMLLVFLISNTLAFVFQTPYFILLLLPFVLYLLVPGLSVQARRLHDTDHSGWLYLISFIPLAGLLILYYNLTEGTRGHNQYGPDSKDPNITSSLQDNLV